MISIIIRLLLVLLGVYILYKMIWRGEPLPFFKFFKKQNKKRSPAALEEMKKDPVCGTYIPENQAIQYLSGGETYYFCSQECKKKFHQLYES